MVTGGCLCGTVRWRARGDLTPLSHCHCSMCRKAHAVAFASFTSCAAEDFEWLDGADTVREYASSEQLRRRFCAICGSSLPCTVASIGRMFLPVGTIDGDPGLSGGCHLFVASRADWHEITDQLDRHDTYPVGPGMYAGLPAHDHPVDDAPGDDKLRGSCLCGQVAFEVSEPFKVIHNCHCSRCRKARGAAHATNGFIHRDALTFVRGEDLVTEYKLPEAKTFGQAFCSVCGSGLPRRNPVAPIANVPLGTLDSPTGQRPDDHIHVASMAPWYEITDDMKQFDEGPP